MSYNYTVRIEVPASQTEVAAKIGMSMDPDAGGRLSFNPVIIGYTEGEMPEPIYAPTITAAGEVSDEFLANAQAMMADATLLHQVVAADYAARWAELVPPTLAECESFVNAIIQPTGEPT